MNDKTLARLKKDPAFKALEAVYRALRPLDAEKRRRVVEAVHTLLEISPGKNRKKGK